MICKHLTNEKFANKTIISSTLIFLFLFLYFSSLCLVLTIATAVTSSPVVSTSHKYRDSKISRIQPYIHDENDATIKYYQVDKFTNKKTPHKVTSATVDGKMKTLTNHELLKYV